MQKGGFWVKPGRALACPLPGTWLLERNLPQESLLLDPAEGEEQNGQRHLWPRGAGHNSQV